MTDRYRQDRYRELAWGIMTGLIGDPNMETTVDLAAELRRFPAVARIVTKYKRRALKARRKRLGWKLPPRT